MKEITGRYPICAISSKDKELRTRADAIRQRGVTHEDIYKAGLLKYEMENK